MANLERPDQFQQLQALYDQIYKRYIERGETGPFAAMMAEIEFMKEKRRLCQKENQ